MGAAKAAFRGKFIAAYADAAYSEERSQINHLRLYLKKSGKEYKINLMQTEGGEQKTTAKYME